MYLPIYLTNVVSVLLQFTVYYITYVADFHLMIIYIYCTFNSLIC